MREDRMLRLRMKAKIKIMNSEVPLQHTIQLAKKIMYTILGRHSGESFLLCSPKLAIQETGSETVHNLVQRLDTLTT